MKKRQNDFDDEDILDIVDEALKEAYINTDERLIVWPNGERLTVDQSAEKIIGENDLDNEVVKDCIMAWVGKWMPNLKTRIKSRKKYLLKRYKIG